MKNIKTLVAATFAGAVFTSSVQAMTVDAKDSEVAPPGTTIFGLYNQYGVSDQSYALGNRQPGNPRLTTNVTILRFVHYIELGPFIFGPNILQPIVNLDASRDISALGRKTGMGDTTLVFPFWLNKPGAKTEFSVTNYIIAPTGQYNKNSSLNIGSNRWSYDLQVGMVEHVTNNFSFSLLGDEQWNGRNEAYGAGRQTLRQRPLYNLQAFAVYQVLPGLNLHIGLQRVGGGENFVDGVSQNDRQATNKIQLGGSYFFTPKQQILLTWGRDMSTRSGFKDKMQLNVRYLVLF